MAPFYLNKKNKKVFVKVSRHAYHQFKTRWCLMYPESTFDLDKISENVESRFNSASRVTKLSKWETTRTKRHGPAMYFRCRGFTFVVSNQTIVTIELSDKDKRHLNKGKEKT